MRRLVDNDAVPLPDPALSEFADARPPSRPGLYRKPTTLPSERHKPAQIEWLVGIFMDGVAVKSRKRTAENAVVEMRGVRDIVTNRRVFSVRSKLGRVLRVEQLRSWFSSFKAKRDKGTAVEDPREAYWRCFTVAELRSELDESGLSKVELVKRVLAREQGGPLIKGFVDGAYRV